MQQDVAVASDLGQRVFVGAIWLAMSAAALLFVYLFGSGLLCFDEWALVPVLSGNQPLSWAWLVEPANEHLVPVSKALAWAFWRVSGGNPKSLMYFNVLLLSAAALALIFVSRRLRGQAAYTDALFPFLLLHWGHAENFLTHMQTCMITPVCLFLLLAMLLARSDRPMGLPATLAAAVCLVLLPLHGGVGMAFAPAAVLGAVLLAASQFGQTPERRRTVPLLLAIAALLTVALMGWYLMHVRAVPIHHVGGATPAEIASATMRCAGMALGVAGCLPKNVAGEAVFLVSLVTAGMLAWDFLKRPEARWPVAGLLVSLAGAWTLALVIGVSRAKFGGAAMRYEIMAAPILACVYLAWARRETSGLGRFVLTSLFTVLCALSTYHAKVGLDFGANRASSTRQFVEGIEEGVPLSGLAGRVWPDWAFAESDVAEGLETLRSAKVGQFAAIRPDPPWEVLPLLRAAAASPAVASADRQKQRYEFSLGKRRTVYAVRLKYTTQESISRARFELAWPEAASTQPWDFRRLGFDYLVHNNSATHTIWLNEPMDRFCLRLGTAPLRQAPAELTALRLRALPPATQMGLEAVEALVKPEP